MKKKIITLLLFLSFFIGNGYGQLDSFNLRNFKLPELKRQALDLSFDIAGQNNAYHVPYISFYSSGITKLTDNNYNANEELNYSFYLNRPKVQREINGGFSFIASYTNHKTENHLTDENYLISPFLYGSLINRNYFDNNIFIETDLYGSFIFQKSQLEDFSMMSDKDNSQLNNTTVDAPVKLGFGRIEEVQDARQAVYIFDELAKLNRVKKNISNDDITALAQFISMLNNKRFFDSRLRRIYEIEAVDSFLRSNNFTVNSDAVYFTTLTDYWDYGNLPERKSGSRLSFCVYPGYFNYNIHEKIIYNEFITETLETNSRVNLFMISGGFEFLHERPINLHWQNTIEINGYAGSVVGKSKDQITPTDYKLKIPNLQVEYMQKIGYYPNTRTDVEFGYGIAYGQLFGKSDYSNNKIGPKGQGAKAFSNLSIYYYLSPQLRISLFSSLNYVWQDSDDEAIIDFDYPSDFKLPLMLNTDLSTSYSSYISYLAKELHYNFEFKLTYSFF